MSSHTLSGLRGGFPMIARGLIVVVAAVGWLLAAGGNASAHAQLLSTSPTSGAVETLAPRQVTLVFAESVRLFDDSIRVISPDGTRVDMGPPRHIGGDENASVKLRTNLRQGSYTVAWRAVSEDSHVISGAFVFTYGHTSATASVPAVHAGPSVSLLYGTARAVAYTGYALTIGPVGFVLLCWPRGASRRAVRLLMLLGWTTLTVATAAALLLCGPYQSAGPLSDAFDVSLVSGTLHTPIGGGLAQRLVLLAAIGLFLRLLLTQLGRRPAPVTEDQEQSTRELRDIRLGLAGAGIVLAVALSVNWASVGHAAEGIQVPVAMASDSLHLLAMGMWLGGLVALLVFLGTRPGHTSPSAQVVNRFSLLAETCVAVLIVTGIYQSWRGLGSWSALPDTQYGRLLLLKIATVALLVSLGGLSRRHLIRQRGNPTPLPSSGAVTRAQRSATTTVLDRPAVTAAVARADSRRLRRSVTAETAIAAAVLAATTLLTNTAPARNQTRPTPGSAQQVQEVRTTIAYDTEGTTANAEGRVRIALRPAGAGSWRLTAQVTDASGRPTRVPEVRISFALPDRHLGPLRAVLARSGRGNWVAPAVQLPFPGLWKMQVTVRSSDIDQVTRTAAVRIE